MSTFDINAAKFALKTLFGTDAPQVLIDGVPRMFFDINTAISTIKVAAEQGRSLEILTRGTAFAVEDARHINVNPTWGIGRNGVVEFLHFYEHHEGGMKSVPMPGCDGVEILFKLRANNNYKFDMAKAMSND